LKYIQQRFSRKIVRLLLDELHRLPEDERSRRYAEAFYSAIIKVKEQEEIELFVAQAREMRYRDSEEAVMTYGEQLLKEGMEKGREEGREEGRIRDKQEVVTRLLRKRFGVSREEVAAVEHISNGELLDALIDEIAVAESKEQVLRILYHKNRE